MGISFSGAGFDIGSIRTRHETSTELSSSSGYDALPQEYPIPDPGPDTPISAEKKLSLKMIVLGPSCDSEAHLGLVRDAKAYSIQMVLSLGRESIAQKSTSDPPTPLVLGILRRT